MPRVLKKGYFRFSQRLHGGVERTGPEIRLRAAKHVKEKFTWQDSFKLMTNRI
jgi:hypothetical protein